MTGLEAPESESRNERSELGDFLRVHPDDPILRRARGLSLLRAGRLSDARPDLEAAARAIDNDPLGRVALAECRVAAGNLDDVAAALGAEPTTDRRLLARWWLVQTQVAEVRGQFDQALILARKALVANPDDRTALYRVGQLLIRAGQPTEAAPLLARSEAIRARDLALVLELDRCLRGGSRPRPLRAHRRPLPRLGDACRSAGMVR